MKIDKIKMYWLMAFLIIHYKYIFQTGWLYSNFVSIVLTPLVNRLVTPVGAMRSSILNVWMMTLKQARLVGVLRGDVSAV